MPQVPSSVPEYALVCLGGKGPPSGDEEDGQEGLHAEGQLLHDGLVLLLPPSSAHASLSEIKALCNFSLLKHLTISYPFPTSNMHSSSR